MLLTTEVFSPRLTTTSYERSLKAAREHEVRTALDRLRETRRSQKRTEPWRWLIRRVA
jgi:hypothetical protein